MCYFKSSLLLSKFDWHTSFIRSASIKDKRRKVDHSLRTLLLNSLLSVVVVVVVEVVVVVVVVVVDDSTP